MAARLEGYTTTTAVLGGNRVMTVHQLHCYSQPSETYFEFRARIQTTRAEAQAIANGVSAEIEATLAQPTVTDIAWSQDVKPSGQLIGGEAPVRGWDVLLPVGERALFRERNCGD